LNHIDSVAYDVAMLEFSYAHKLDIILNI